MMRKFVFFNLALFCGIVCSSCHSSTQSETPQDTGFGHGVNGPVKQVLYVGNTLYVAGDFDSAGNKWSRGLAKWDGTTWSTIDNTAFSPFEPGSVNALASDGTSLYAGGSFLFTANGVNGDRLTQWDGTKLRGFPGIPGSITSAITLLAFDQGTLYTGDDASRVSSYDGQQWTNDEIGYFFQNPTSMTAGGGAMYATFEYPADTVYRFSNLQWKRAGAGFHRVKSNLTTFNQIYFFRDTLYAIGNFDRVGSLTLTSPGIARWDGSKWSNVGTTALTASARAMTVDDAGNVYVAVPNAILKFDGAQWSTFATTSGGFGNLGTVTTMSWHNGTLAVAGDYTSVNGAPAVNPALIRP